MEFEWDQAKAAANAKKHGVGVPEATTVFGDPFELTIPDSDHSEGEDRFLSLGLSVAGRLVVVAYLNEAAESALSTLGRRLLRSAGYMNQTRHRKTDALRPGYDFSRGVRGKHHGAYKAGTNVVVLDADVATAFPNSSSVNRALRLLLEVAKKQLSSKRTA